jgi:hypothetical protein
MIPFRNLLIMLDVSQVDSYLLANGWTRLQPVGTEIQTYRLPIEGTDDVCDVMIPTDRARHQFIDRLYKLVFNVSCIEDREPFEVAGDMLEHKKQSQTSVTADVCVKTVLNEELTRDSGVLSTEQVERLVNDLEQIIARAEFVAAGFGGPDLFDQAMRMKTAIVMVPVTRELAQLCDISIGAEIVHRIIGRILQVEISTSAPITHELFITLRDDNEAAPMDSLRLLKEIGIP